MSTENDYASEVAPAPTFPLAPVGEFILRGFERVSETEPVSLDTEGAAVVAGLRGALCRVFLVFALPSACVFAALGYEQIVQWLGGKWGLSSSGNLTNGGLVLIAVAGGGGCFWAAHQIYTDADDKWRRLHWFYFGLFAAVLLNCYGPMLLLLVVAALHFVVHLAVHRAFQARNIPDPEESLEVKKPVVPEKNSGS